MSLTGISNQLIAFTFAPMTSTSVLVEDTPRIRCSQSFHRPDSGEIVSDRCAFAGRGAYQFDSGDATAARRIFINDDEGGAIEKWEVNHMLGLDLTFEYGSGNTGLYIKSAIGCLPWWSSRSATGVRYIPRQALYGRTRLRSRGNRQASFTLARPRIFCVSRSRPMAKPPCGGQPYLKIDR